ncbi:threonine/serine exporter family protein [Enterococcus raffinosus]|uniref:threonine/serine exporter family protein n=1 Tax=Enterococcus TaxID=1350 RepID=UPI001C48AEB0|nr:threonine/serine exporter family protein [Enterococcus raffinosus]QXJ58135.1 threonine/serine exporter family protein [Enterococcus raffinosus]
MTFVINFLFSMFSTIAFSVITNIPRRAFLACGFTGAAGWMTFWILQTYCHQNIGISNFLGAMMIGLISIFFSRIMHMPVIVFNVPSLVPLVPGGPAYMAVRYMMNQEFTESMEKVVTVLVTAGAIAIGFMFTNLIERALKRTRSNFQLK